MRPFALFAAFAAAASLNAAAQQAAEPSRPTAEPTRQVAEPPRQSRVPARPAPAAPAPAVPAETGFFRPAADPALTSIPPAPLAASVVVAQEEYLSARDLQDAERQMDRAEAQHMVATGDIASRRPVITSPLYGTAPIMSPLDGTAPIVSPIAR